MARRDSWLLVDVTFKEAFTNLINTMDVRAEDALYGLGTAVRDNAKPPVDTGALKASGSVYTRRKSDFRQRVQEAKSKRPNASFATKINPGRMAVHIHWPIHYATYQELGTRFHAAQPFAVQAMNATNMSLALQPFIKEFQNELIFKRTVFRVR